METHTYKPLSGSRNTRLLILEPSADFAAPLHTRLEELNLDRSFAPTGTAVRPYETLSYVWGERLRTHAVTCDGELTYVTANCNAALRHLRKSHEERTLWIDALCIDQENVDERAIQVSLMGDIYSSSERTIIWLGPGEEERDKQFFKRVSAVSELQSLDSSKKSPVWLRVWNSGVQKVADWMMQRSRTPQDFDLLVAVCSNPWFARVWTLQEGFLSKRAVVLSGYEECPLVDLIRYCDWLGVERDTAWATALNPMIGRMLFHGLVRRFCNGPKEQRNLEYAEGSELKVADDFRADRDRWFTFIKMLPYWLHQVRFNEATDPRDKVYGLLGILGRLVEELGDFPVDYTASVTEVYERFTKEMIRLTARLGHLEVMRPRVIVELKTTTKEDPIPELPSWVLDMSERTAGRSSVFQGGMMKSFAAKGSDIDLELFAASPPGMLLVRGIRISEIDVVAEQRLIACGPEQSYDEQKAVLETWITMVRNAERWAYGTIDRVSSLKKFLRVTRQRFEDNRVVFLTRTGHVGISGHEIRAGDEVVILAGGDCPVVLRREAGGEEAGDVGSTADMGETWESKDNTGGDTKGRILGNRKAGQSEGQTGSTRYRFMGPAPVHGTANWELWDSETPVNVMEIFALV